jgi:sulfotransferase
VIKYESLARQPQATMARLYQELGEPLFEHDFEHIEYDEPDYHLQLGMPELHRFDRKWSLKRESSLPPDLITKYATANFWLKPGLNGKQITIT